jgi:hypothetical protein
MGQSSTYVGVGRAASGNRMSHPPPLIRRQQPPLCNATTATVALTQHQQYLRSNYLLVASDGTWHRPPRFGLISTSARSTDA